MSRKKATSMPAVHAVFAKAPRRSLPPPSAFGWCTLILILISSDYLFVNADCWYESKRHEEGVQVVTNEPCLNCTCSRGALLCYLRVCPRLPNPPPSGCILLHRFKACCPELICADIPAGNSIEGRTDFDPMEEILQAGAFVGNQQRQMLNACVTNGSIYAPGSAMDSSSSCEYCYCLGGRQECVRPKCLLPLDGCRPAYDSVDECCPTRYNCTRDLFTTTSTTTLAPREYTTQGGCVIDGGFYPEGGKVLGIGHSACDNCYCLRGLVRCEPLSCATPLLGCTPVIRAGECCAASYNCSGAIETQPEPHYGQFPTVSKEYAKLRKEVQHKRTTMTKTQKPPTNNIPFYVIAESTNIYNNPNLHNPKAGLSTAEEQKYPTTRSYLGSTQPITNRFITQSPFYYNVMKTSNARNNGLLESLLRESPENDKKPQQPEIYYVPTKVETQAAYSAYPDIYREDSLATTIRHKKFTSSAEVEEVNEVQNIQEERIIRGIINRTRDISVESEDINLQSENVNVKSEDMNIESRENTTAASITSTLNDSTVPAEAATQMTTANDDLTTTQLDLDSFIALTTGKLDTENDVLTDSQENEKDRDITSTVIYDLVELITVRTVSNSTDCYNVTIANYTMNNDESKISPEHSTINFDTSTTESSAMDDLVTDTTMADSTTMDSRLLDDVESKQATIPAITKIALQNIMAVNKSLDYDYDYNAPTLPPSLPNLRIIPFVAADAVESQTAEKKNRPYVDDKDFEYNNKFSPPVETEGGFVPKQPPLMIDFYEDYRTTKNGVTAMPAMPSLTNPPKSDENNCMMDNKEVKHGESVASEGNCALCVCFYGSIVCHEPQCALPRAGCRNSNKIDRLTCCPDIICDKDESPTVVIDTTSNSTIAESVTPADPFRDVIRTEPAPDLQLLIGDMSNYLKSTTTTTSTTEVLPAQTNITNTTGNSADVDDDKELSFNKLWDMIFNPDEVTTRLSAPIVSSANVHGDQIAAPQHQLETRENIDGNLGIPWPSPSSAIKRQDYAVPGLLKLAGCNIYGRMYRVGRIISELSGPCLECKCTEVGVQCENLSC